MSVINKQSNYSLRKERHTEREKAIEWTGRSNQAVMSLKALHCAMSIHSPGHCGHSFTLSPATGHWTQLEIHIRNCSSEIS